MLLNVNDDRTNDLVHSDGVQNVVKLDGRKLKYIKV
jgi:hypothetical protein